MASEGDKEYVIVDSDKLSTSPTLTYATSDGIGSSVASSGSDWGDAVEVDDVPKDVPYLPALDQSTEITKYEGFREAVEDMQAALDSRLLAFSRYQQMSRTKEILITARPSNLRPSVPAVAERPVTVCMGWHRVGGLDASSRDLLRQLEEDGVTYEPHDTAYSVKYLAPVAPFGDCLFLSMEQLLLYTEECEPLDTQGIRQVATKYFMAHYRCSSEQEQQKIDQAIQNLYFPSLKGGWGVSPIQTRRFVAKKEDKSKLEAKCRELEAKGYSRRQAAEFVYTQCASPVWNADAYCSYMQVGKGPNEYCLIGLNYSQNGLVSIDTGDGVAWGDDIVLEALATAFQRDIFVVLVGCGKMFFLPHHPRSRTNIDEEPLCSAKGHAPWFLLMRLTGSDRGGDHYEPMLCERLRGDGSSEFGSIGD